MFIPLHLSYLARAYADLGQFEEAERCIEEAIATMDATKESWCEAELYRLAGEIALKSPEPRAAKAEAHFDRALTVAEAQRAKSWELRAAMSKAAPVARSGEARSGPRSSQASLRLVHRRFRHARSEASQGAAR